MPQAVLAEAAAPPVAVDEVTAPSVLANEAAAPPAAIDEAAASRSRTWKRNRRKASSTLQGLEAVPESSQVVVLCSTLVASCSAGTTLAPLSTFVSRSSAATRAWPTIPPPDLPPAHLPLRHFDFWFSVCGASRIRFL